MRLRNVLDGVLGSQVRVKTARIITIHPRLEYTGREIAILASVSQPQANEALRSLEAYGVLESRAMGRAIIWRVKRENAVYKMLVRLFTEEVCLIADLKGDLCGALKPLSEKVMIFGSISRGEGGESSDLDLCVVTRNKEKVVSALSVLAPKILRKYNIVVSPLIYSPGEYARSKITEEGEEICKRDQ